MQSNFGESEFLSGTGNLTGRQWLLSFLMEGDSVDLASRSEVQVICIPEKYSKMLQKREHLFSLMPLPVSSGFPHLKCLRVSLKIEIHTAFLPASSRRVSEATACALIAV